jgi:exopolysaccharide biosynthesis operon protein EpsL
VLLSLQAAAQEDLLVFRVGGAVNWDSNVFRLPDSAPDPQPASGTPGKSDRYATAYLGLRFDKSYSQQRLTLDIVDRAIRYDKFSSLDHDELDYRGEWQWRVGPRIAGALRADRTESLASFEDTRTQPGNVSITTNYGLTLDGQLSAGWHLLAGVSESERKNSETFLAMPDSRQTGGDVGLRYVAQSQNSITYMWRTRSGANTAQAVNFVNFTDSDFKVQENELSASWTAGGQHLLTGRLTHTAYRYENIPQRNFSGNAGELADTWALTGALTVRFSGQRSVVSWTPDTGASYRVDDTIAIAPAWRISDKTALQLRVYRTTSEFLGPVVPVAGQAQRDTQRGVRFAATWSPLDRLNLAASLQYEKRSSAVATSNFDATVAGLDASWSF